MKNNFPLPILSYPDGAAQSVHGRLAVPMRTIGKQDNIRRKRLNTKLRDSASDDDYVYWDAMARAMQNAHPDLPNSTMLSAKRSTASRSDVLPQG